MEESLRAWCLQSLLTARQSLSATTLQADASNLNLVAEAEVNASAFQAMLALRRQEIGDSSNDQSRLNTSYSSLSPCGKRLGKSSSSADSPVPINLAQGQTTATGHNRELIPSLDATCPLNGSHPPETLGSIHEFLVTLRDSPLTGIGRRSAAATRKANGIFYTPGYVVDEIVDQTLRPRLQAGEARIRILDPACGCGAFLVAAFRYLVQWHIDSATHNHAQAPQRDFVAAPQSTELPYHRCRQILNDQLFGVDLDEAAIHVVRRILWLTLVDVSAQETIPPFLTMGDDDLSINFKHANALLGCAFEPSTAAADSPSSRSATSTRFEWSHEFPQVCEQGGFDIVIGNPPYRREKNFKRELDEISTTPLGKKYRTARMDLWYYFLHRGIELLRTNGILSFITNAYWLHGRGAEKLIAALRDEVHLDELFLLRDQPVFEGVIAHHVILRITKTRQDEGTTIKLVPAQLSDSAKPYLTGEASVRTFVKTGQQLFRNGYLDVMPTADSVLEKLNNCCPLAEMGIIRQGIAENPAAINRATMGRFPEDSSTADWKLGEGVFSLQAQEVAQLELSADESKLLRPYHDLCDLRRYWAAANPSRTLIYSTRDTCPDITPYQSLHRHLSRFKAILLERRETRKGTRDWWHLHWPRDKQVWTSNKLIALQMATRPSFVPIIGPSYVPFSANVFISATETREHLYYTCGLLNSQVLWAWFSHHAKRRGIGLELNGHILEKAPVRRIDFNTKSDVRMHDEIVSLVDRRLKLSLQQEISTLSDSPEPHFAVQIDDLEQRIDTLVASLYDLNPSDIELVKLITAAELRNT